MPTHNLKFLHQSSILLNLRQHRLNSLKEPQPQTSTSRAALTYKSRAQFTSHRVVVKESCKVQSLPIAIWLRKNKKKSPNSKPKFQRNRAKVQARPKLASLEELWVQQHRQIRIGKTKMHLLAKKSSSFMWSSARFSFCSSDRTWPTHLCQWPKMLRLSSQRQLLQRRRKKSLTSELSDFSLITKARTILSWYTFDNRAFSQRVGTSAKVYLLSFQTKSFV